MRIFETCENGPWELTFDCEGLDKIGLNDEQKTLIHRGLHVYGDVISWLTGFTDNGIINPALIVLLTEVHKFADTVQNHLGELLEGRIWLETPEGAYSYESLFGSDIFADFEETLDDDMDKATYQDSFPFSRGKDLKRFVIGPLPDIHSMFEEDDEDEEDEGEEWLNQE